VKVLSDASPLIILTKASYLDLLPSLYGTLAVTPEVYREVPTREQLHAVSSV